MYETWPEALKAAVSICLNSRFPISLWWGPELIMFYNDAWPPILGKTKHPAGLGRPGFESWPEIWNIIGPQFTSVLTRGRRLGQTTCCPSPNAASCVANSCW